MDLSGDWLKAIFTAATIGISYAGYRLSQRGQAVSDREQHFAQEFAALKQVNEALQAENKRQREDLADARERSRQYRSVIRDEWEPRWSRQMERCRVVTESLVQTIASLRTSASPKQRAEAEDALRDLEQHRDTDHIDANDFDTTD